MTAICIGVLSSAQAGAAPAHGPVERAIEKLQQGDAAGALETLRRLLKNVGPNLVPGESHGEALGSPLLYRAVAEFELGLTHDARWSWHMALIFNPDLARLDLRALGPAGDFLLAHPSLEPEIEVQRPTQEGFHLDGLGAGVQPPRKVHASSPAYSEDLRRKRLEGDVLLLVKIREDGRLESPKLLKDDPRSGFLYSLLEAMRTWEFEPARVDGKQVAVWYTVGARFRLV